MYATSIVQRSVFSLQQVYNEETKTPCMYHSVSALTAQIPDHHSSYNTWSQNLKNLETQIDSDEWNRKAIQHAMFVAKRRRHISFQYCKAQLPRWTIPKILRSVHSRFKLSLPYTELRKSQKTMNTRFSAVGMPVGWAAIAKTVRDIDEDKIRNCKEDIDTLLVFVSSGTVNWRYRY